MTSAPKTAPKRKPAAPSKPKVAKKLPHLTRVKLTPKQRAAQEEILAMMLRHNPEPTAEELEAIRREWE